MFILLSLESDEFSSVKELANEKNERYRVNKDGISWFSNDLNDPPALSTEDAKRVSFNGHALINYFQNYAPKQFVAMLQVRKTNNDFPDTIETLDLIGCDIGLRETPESLCWVEKTAALLAQESQFDHIKYINTVFYDNRENKYASLIVNKGREGYLITREDNDKFNHLLLEKDTLKKEQETLEDELNSLYITLERLENEEGELQDKINALKTKLKDILGKYNPQKKEYIETKECILQALEDETYTVKKLTTEPYGSSKLNNAIKHLDSLKQYHLELKSIQGKKQQKEIAWKDTGQRISETIPSLINTLKNEMQDIAKKNPLGTGGVDQRDYVDKLSGLKRGENNNFVIHRVQEASQESRLSSLANGISNFIGGIFKLPPEPYKVSEKTFKGTEKNFTDAHKPFEEYKRKVGASSYTKYHSISNRWNAESSNEKKPTEDAKKVDKTLAQEQEDTSKPTDTPQRGIR